MWSICFILPLIRGWNAYLCFIKVWKNWNRHFLNDRSFMHHDLNFGAMSYESACNTKLKGLHDQLHDVMAFHHDLHVTWVVEDVGHVWASLFLVPRRASFWYHQTYNLKSCGSRPMSQNETWGIDFSSLSIKNNPPWHHAQHPRVASIVMSISSWYFVACQIIVSLTH